MHSGRDLSSLKVGSMLFRPAGQLNLAKSSVLVVGCGGLGCPLAQYLAAAGIGTMAFLLKVSLEELHCVSHYITYKYIVG